MTLAILDTDGLAILDTDGLAILDTTTVAVTPDVPPAPRTDWRVYVRDEQGHRVAELDAFADASMVSRFNAVGSWRLKAPYSSAAVLAATPKYGLEFVRNGTVVLSGPVTARARRFDATFDGFEFTGVDDTWWLEQRLASPEPFTTSAPYNVSAHDVRTGAATSVLTEYVNLNAGPDAVTGRAVSGLTIGVDPVAGATVTGRARWQVLLDLLTELAAAGDVGFRVRQLTFETYVPADRSAQVVFSVGLGNLAAFTYTEAAPEANHVYVAGSGEETLRVIREATDSASVARWGRVESFRDRRDTDDLVELDQAAQETLTDGASRVGFSLTPIETESIRFIDDYQLGDLVTAVVDGTPVVDVIREVTITLNERGETVTPTVGDPNANPQRPRIYDAFTRLGRRVRNLERNI